MKVGELFINLGLTGLDAVKIGMQKVTSGLKEITSASWELKLTSLAAVYSLGKLAEFATGNAMSFKNFADETQLSTDKLQRWQAIGLESGVTAEEMTGSIQNLQSVIGKMRSGQGAPSGWDVFSTSMGITEQDAEDTFLVLQKLREFAQSNPRGLPITMMNEYIESFVGNQKVVGLLRTSHTELDKIPKSLILTQREIKRASALQAEWNKFSKDMEITGQRIAMTYAPGMMRTFESFLEVFKSISKDTNNFEFLANSVTVLADVAQNVSRLLIDFPQLKWLIIGIGMALTTYFSPITAVITGIIFLLDQIQRFRMGKSTVLDDISEFSKDIWSIMMDGKMREKELPKEFFGKDNEKNKFIENIIKPDKEKGNFLQQIINPMKPIPTEKGKEGASYNIEQNLNFNHDGSDSFKTASSVEQAVKNAFYQLPSNTVVT